MTELVMPVDPHAVHIVQSYADHVAWAQQHGMCARPGGSCPNGYYYGGIDYAPNIAGNNLCIYAAAGGTVSRVGWVDESDTSKGYGYHVRIKHAGGYETIYGHLSPGSALVYTGQKVSTSQVLGRMGGSGNCRPPGYVHLHFELRSGGVPVDPAPFLAGWTGGPPAEEPPPTVTPPPVFEPPTQSNEVALVARWRLLSDWLNIRNAPSVYLGQVVGQMAPTGSEFDGVAITHGDGQGIWVRDADGNYRAATHSGTKYLEIKE